MPPASEGVVIVGSTGFGLMVTLKVLVSLPILFAARTVKEYVPGVVGLPDITPPLDRLSPGGRLPELRLQVIAAVPVAAIVLLYELPTVASESEVVAIIGAPGLTIVIVYVFSARVVPMLAIAVKV